MRAAAGAAAGRRRNANTESHAVLRLARRITGIPPVTVTFSLVVPVVVRLGAPFKDASRTVLFADLRGRRGGVASWASTHGMNLPSHKD